MGFTLEETQTSSHRTPLPLLNVTETSSLCSLSDVVCGQVLAAGTQPHLKLLPSELWTLGLCSAFFHLTYTRFTWGPPGR